MEDDSGQLPEDAEDSVMREVVLPHDDSIFYNLSGRVDDPGSDSLREDSFSEFTASASKQAFSTPKRLPSAPKVPKDSSRLKCPKCPSTFANKRTLDVHLRGHVMKGLTSHAPTKEDLSQEMPSLLETVLIEMVNKKIFQELSSEEIKYASDILESVRGDLTGGVNVMVAYLSDSFDSILKMRKVLFPSAIRTALNIGTNQLVNCKVFRKKMKEQLVSLKEALPRILNTFLGKMVFYLSRKIHAYATRKMQGNVSQINEGRKKRSGDDVQSDKFRQMAYYIGGSIVSGFIYKGEKYSKTSRIWTVFVDVLKRKFLQSGDNACADLISAFTKTKDRGGLKHLSTDAFDFFLNLFNVLMCHEETDGSLPPNVIDSVILTNDVLLCLWDEVVGHDLNEELALDLLIQIGQSCTQVVMKGILKRRLNNRLKQSYSSVPLRAKLAK